MLGCYTVDSLYCTLADCCPPADTACSLTDPPASVAEYVDRSDPVEDICPYTVTYAVVPSCTISALATSYSELAESVVVMNASADLNEVALNVMMSVAADVKLVDAVSVVNTPPDAAAVLSNPTIANILAAE